MIALYLESFGNPRKFVRIASRVARAKPIVAVKSGRSPAGARGAMSHSAALATSDDVAELVLSRAGVTRVDTLEELFDTTQAFASQPALDGRRVAIVGNAGGPAILAADAATAHGLLVPELSARNAGSPRPASCRRRQQLATRSTSSPPARPWRSSRRFAPCSKIPRSMRCWRSTSRRCRIVIARCSTQSPRQPRSRPDKTMLATVLAGNETVQLDGIKVPTYRFPESAVRALAHMASRSDWLRSDNTAVAEQLIDEPQARKVASEFLRDMPEGGWLDTSSAVALASAAGLPLVETAIVASARRGSRGGDAARLPGGAEGFRGIDPPQDRPRRGHALSLVDEQAVIDAGSAMRETTRRRPRGLCGADAWRPPVSSCWQASPPIQRSDRW